MSAVLFVCTGNICRSPTAEGVFRHIVEQEGMAAQFIIDSAGTHGYHVGEHPDSRAVQAARQRGVEMSDLVARKVTKADFERFDLILAMDSGHLQILERLRPSKGSAELAMFMDFAPDSAIQDVPDPYYGAAADFDHALDLVEEGARGLFNHLKNKNKT